MNIGGRSAFIKKFGDDRLGRLERAGIIRRGTGAVPAVLLRRPVAKPTRSLVQALLEEREEGR
jgi:hypothetical protein